LISFSIASNFFLNHGSAVTVTFFSPLARGGEEGGRTAPVVAPFFPKPRSTH
jgi:hypothetical protein